jgi:molecular chaperone GrpE
MSEMTGEEEGEGEDRKSANENECLSSDLHARDDNAALLQELETQARLAEQRLDQIRYLQADFDNYRKQFEKEKERIIRYAEANLIREILPIVDDLERTARSISDPVIREGAGMIYRNFMSILSHYGVSRIESLGKKFDPSLHEVLCQEKSNDKEGTVIEEFSPGYVMKSLVLRPSRVKVAAHKDEREE